MGSRAVLVVYFLIAAVAAFVTAARTMSTPVLLAVLLALGVAAMLLRRQIGLGGTTRVTAAWLAVYLVTYAAIVVLFRR